MTCKQVRFQHERIQFGDQFDILFQSQSKCKYYICSQNSIFIFDFFVAKNAHWSQLKVSFNFQTYVHRHPMLMANMYPPPVSIAGSSSAHQPQCLPGGLQSSTSSIPSAVIYQQQHLHQQQQPQTNTGAYTLPPAAAFFPMATYNTIQQMQQQQQLRPQMLPNFQQPNPDPISGGGTTCNVPSTANTSVYQANPDSGSAQPNTPDLLIHRRHVSY